MLTKVCKFILLINKKRKSYSDLIEVNGQISVVDTEQLSWPEMLGKDGEYAVRYIKQKSGE